MFLLVLTGGLLFFLPSKLKKKEWDEGDDFSAGMGLWFIILSLPVGIIWCFLLRLVDLAICGRTKEEQQPLMNTEQQGGQEYYGGGAQ